MFEFILELSNVKVILDGLKKLRSETTDEDGLSKIDDTICVLKSQMMGELKTLQGFMRNTQWLHEQVIYEVKGERGRACATKNCKNASRGERCAECWRRMMTLVHGGPNHVCKK